MHFVRLDSLRMWSMRLSRQMIVTPSVKWTSAKVAQAGYFYVPEYPLTYVCKGAEPELMKYCSFKNAPKTRRPSSPQGTFP